MKDSFFTLTFFVRKPRSEGNGEYPIYARISSDGQVKEFTIGRKVHPDIWDQRRQMTRGRSRRDLELFAERKETQKMLQRIVRHRYGYTSKIINGNTPTASQPYAGKQSRQSAIDDFQSKPGFGVIIMSPVAAGMGLNVTAANHVIHYSRHWNPAKENQATDRAYRIGQGKDVYVYYPMAVSSAFQSFDVTLDDLLSRKTNLATCTIFPTERVEVKPEDFENILHL